MAEVDERIVSMGFDNRQFEAGAAQSISTLDKLKKALSFDKQEEAFGKLEKTANSLNFSKLQDSLNQIQYWVSPVGQHITSVFDKAMSYVESKVMKTWNAIFKEAPTEGFKEYELKMGSVQTIMASTGETLETVNGYLDELNLYADKTIYSFSDMTQNIGKFTNAGVKLKDAVAAIQGVSNVAAVSGANSNEASRAMYNFAQALSAGSVKLIDWKSIENANMATVEFKQQLLDTALALGTVVKEGDKYRSSTVDNNNKVSELFNTTLGFNDSLSHQWMTTEVLVQTLKKYTDETTDIGKKAFKAATEVKTFSQLLDTLKEAMGSGWTESFELIIGDFNEAKELFTMLSDIFSGIITKTDQLRNGLINLWRANGGRDTVIERLKNGLEELDKVYDFSLKKLLGNTYTRAMRTQRKTLETGAEAIESYSEAEIQAAKDITQKGSFGIGEERIKNLEKLGLDAKRVQGLVDRIVSSGYDVASVEKAISEETEKIEDQIDTLEGSKLGNTLENIFETMRNIFGSVKNIINAGYNIFKVFKASAFANLGIETFTEDISSASGAILRLTEKILKFTERNKNVKTLRKVFDSLFTIINKIWSISSSVIEKAYEGISKIATLISKYIPTVMGFFNKVADVILNMDKYVNRVRDSFYSWFASLNKNSLLYKALYSLLYIIESFKYGFKDGTQALFSFAKSFGGGIFEKVKNIIMAVGEGIKSFILSFRDADSPLSKFKSLLKSVWNFLKQLVTFLSPLFDILTDIIDRVANALGTTDLESLLRVLSEGGILYIIQKVISALNSFSSGNIGDTIAGIFGDLGESIGGFLDSFKPDRLKNAAVSIAIMAGSILVLSMINPINLTMALGAIEVVIQMLSQLSNVMQEAAGNKSMKRASAISSALMKTSIALLVLAVSVKALSSINLGNLIKGLGGVFALLAALSLYLNNTDMDNAGFRNGIGLMLLANALLVLTGVVKLLSLMSWETLIKGLTAMSGLLAIIWAFLSHLNSDKIVSVGFGILILSDAILVLTAAIKVLSKIDMADLMKSLFALAGVLVAVGVFSDCLPSDMISKGVGMIGMSIALVILANAMKSLGAMPLANIGKALLALAGSLTLICLALILAEDTLPGAAALLIVSIAIKALAKALKVLGGMTFTDILTALVALAGAFVVIGLAAYALGPSIPVIAGLGGALVVLGAGLALIGGGIALFAIGCMVLAGAVDVVIDALFLALNIFAKRAAEFVLIAETFVIAFMMGILNALPELLQIVGDIILKVLEFIETLVGPVIHKLVDILIALIDSLAYAIIEKEDAIFGAIKKVMVAIGKFVIDALREVLGNIPGLGSLLDSVSLGLDTAFDNLTAGDRAKKMAEGVGDGFEKGTPGATAKAKASGEAIKDGFTEGFNKDTELIPYDPDVFAADPNMMKDFEKQMNDRLGLSAKNGTDAADAEMGNYIDGLTNSQGDVVDIHKMLSDSGYDSMLNPDGYSDAADKNLGGFHKEFKSNFPQTEEEGKEMSEEGANGAASQDWRYARAAQNVCDTFRATLYKNRQKVFERGQEIAKAAADGLEGKLEISSPSKLMMRDGDYTILGFIKGLQQNQKYVEMTSSDLGESVVKSFSSPLDKVRAILQGEEEFDPSIRPTLDLSSVRESAGEIDGIFGNRSVELANINGRIDANNLAMRRLAEQRSVNSNTDVVNAINLMRGDITNLNETMGNTQLVMDTGAVVGAIKRPMDGALGKMNMLKGRRN